MRHGKPGSSSEHCKPEKSEKTNWRKLEKKVSLVLKKRDGERNTRNRMQT